MRTPPAAVLHRLRHLPHRRPRGRRAVAGVAAMMAAAVVLWGVWTGAVGAAVMLLVGVAHHAGAPVPPAGWVPCWALVAAAQLVFAGVGSSREDL